jgi:septal ring factor EnvC (AmiA/AmiB activator)
LEVENSRFHLVNNQNSESDVFLLIQPGINAMTKDELLAKMQATIDEQQANLESLKDKAIDESQEALEDVRAAIADLEPKLDQAKAKFKEISESADDTWDDIKESLESGWDEASAKLEEGWNSLTSTVKSFFS